MIFMTRKRFRKLFDEAIAAREHQEILDRQARQRTGYRPVQNDVKDLIFEVATVHPRDNSLPDRCEITVRLQGEQPFYMTETYETTSVASLTEILTKILRALRDMGVEVVQHEPLPASLELRKGKPAAKEDER